MKWSAHCLAVESVVGVVTLCEHGTLTLRDGVDRREPLIAVCRDASNLELSSLISHTVAGVIVREGSLADHFAVALYGAGIQLAVAPALEMNTLVGRYALIDGVTEIVDVVEDSAELPTQTHRADVDWGAKFEYEVDGCDADDISLGLKAGASGVGLLRTEWFQWNESEPPSQAAYEELYLECAEAVGSRQLCIRLIDVGGDKVPRWAHRESTLLQSPLGYRGIRARQLSTVGSALEAQLKSIVTVARSNPIGIVIPMVTDVRDVEWVRTRLSDLGGITGSENVRLGIMVETPAAALGLDALLTSGVSFVRIGPGDLSQFTLAKERRSLDPVEYSGHGLHAAVQDLVARVQSICRMRGIQVSVCLSIDPRPELSRELRRSGVESLCVPARAIERMARGTRSREAD